MSDSKSTVKALAKALNLSIPDDRLEQVALAWEQALAETDSVRQSPTPMPSTAAYDAAWSNKK